MAIVKFEGCIVQGEIKSWGTMSCLLDLGVQGIHRFYNQEILNWDEVLENLFNME